MEKDKDKIKAWKATADIFFEKGIKVFIKDLTGNFYMGNIVFVGEVTLTIDCFAPIQRKGKRYVLYWTLMDDFREYKEREVHNES